jgi:peroxiredoxin Q/BCP
MSRVITRAAALGLALALIAGTVVKAADLKVGDKAPPFSLVGSDGKTYSLDDFKGKKAVVLAWFPKHHTSGCTAECKSLRDNSAALKSLNVAYFTASVDKPEENKKFAEDLGLDYPILSDPDKTVAQAYGVLQPPRPTMSIRWTFYIDKDGVIREIDKKIRTAQAGADVAAKVKSLGLASQ